MAQATQAFKRLKFGVFEADFRTGELTKHGRRVRLQEQPFQLLAMLLDQPGELVTREELHRKLWPQTIVDFDHGLNKAISKIREALGDSAENPRFIETVARRGYRFLADVAVVYDEPAQQTDAGASEGAPSRALVLKFFGFAAALILAIYLSWSFYPWRQSLPPIHSLAVLPLKNLSGDASQDYFADGMTDELIAYLGQIRALRVISRTSAMTYKNGHKPPAEIARELNVEAVVEGSVVMGQTSEAILKLKKAKSLDTLSLIIGADLVDILCVAHQFDESVQEGKRALEIDPSFAVARYVLGQAYEQKHMQDEAIAEIQRAIEISGHSSVFDSGLAHAYAISGRQQEATTIAKDLESRNDQNPSAEANIALIYVGLGDRDQAMTWLNKAYEARFNPSILLRPFFDPLRSDPRFKDLLRRIGLPN